MSLLTPLISYDHLDVPTILNIAKLKGSAVNFLVPLGVKPFLVSSGVPQHQIREMDWWDELSFPEDENIDPRPPLTFVCVPSQHTSGG